MSFLDNPKYSWLKWILLLPFASLCTIIALFLLRGFLYFTLKSLIEPVPELPERLLTPFVTPLSFIYSIYWFSPKFKLTASFLVAGMWFLGVFSMVIIALSGGKYLGENLEFHDNGIQTVMAVAGIITSMIICYTQNTRLKSTL